MRILVTGSQGQLARSLQERCVGKRPLELVFAGRPDLDLANEGSAEQFIRSTRPDLVINAAAYTAVDQAESEAELAFRINADAAGEIAAACDLLGAPVIQISTDYVFDGEARSAYTEDCSTAPLNVYGRSKLAGEEQVRAANPRHMIVRTSWVYSPFGRNFVRTMLRLAAERGEVQVVDDQIGSPTSALDLADTLLAVAERWSAGDSAGQGATYHLTGRGHCSWAEFAKEIFRLSSKSGGPHASVRPIPSSDFSTPAPRPRRSVLNSDRFDAAFCVPRRRWQEALADVVDRLVAPAND